MDKIFIRNLALSTTIGVYSWEKAIKQTVILDLEMGCDANKVAQTDNVKDTLDYAAICEHMQGYLNNAKFQLIETLAAKLANVLQEEFKISWLKLSVTKPGAIAAAQAVGVVIERAS